MKKDLIILIVIVLGLVWFLSQSKPVEPVTEPVLGAVEIQPPPPTEDYMMSI